MLACFAIEAGRTNGSYIRVKLELPFGWFLLARLFVA